MAVLTGTDKLCFFFFQAEDGIRDLTVTGVQTCALPICWVSGSTTCTPVVGATARSLAACRAAMWCGACGRAGTSPNGTSCGRSCEPLAAVEILGRPRQHFGRGLGERAPAARPRRLRVSP